MALVPDVPRVQVDGDALDVRIDVVPVDAASDGSGVTTLASVTLHATAGTVAVLRVRGPAEFHYAAVIARDGASQQLLRLERRGGEFVGSIALAAGETVFLTVVESDLASGIATLEELVAEGGMGMGGGPEVAEEAGPPEPEPEPEPEFEAAPEPEPEPEFGAGAEDGFGGGLGGGLGGGHGDLGLAPPPVPPPAPPPVVAPPIAEAGPEPGGPGGEPGAPSTPPGGVDGAEVIDAHVAAQMPRRLFEDLQFELLVTLSRDEIKIPKGVAGDDKPIKVRKRGDIRIAVSGEGIDLADGAAAEVTTKLPARGAAFEHRFALVPGDPGSGRITVTVEQDPVKVPLAVITLSAMIHPADEAPAAGQAGPAPLVGVAAVAAPPAALAELPTLVIEETFSRGRSALRISAQVDRSTATNTVRLDDKAAFVAGIHAELVRIRKAYAKAVDVDKVPVETAVAQAEESLREEGARIARDLLGDEVNTLLWRKRDRLGGLMVQTSGDLDIPWEIVHLVRVGDQEPDDASHFLGDKGVTRWLWGTPRPTRLAVAVDRVVAIAPVYREQKLRLQGAEDEVSALQDALRGPTRGADTRADVRRTIAGGFDLLHFAGHGRWRDTDPRGQEIALADFVEGRDDGSASYSDSDAREDFVVGDAAGGAASTPFVFLSACDVGRLQQGASGLGGFAEVFLRGGAGVFVGCTWAVRDDVTAVFATTLYEHLLTRGATVGEAAAAARAAAREAHDLTALAFTVFADPRATLVRT